MRCLAILLATTSLLAAGRAHSAAHGSASSGALTPTINCATYDPGATGADGCLAANTSSLFVLLNGGTLPAGTPVTGTPCTVQSTYPNGWGQWSRQCTAALNVTGGVGTVPWTGSGHNSVLETTHPMSFNVPGWDYPVGAYTAVGSMTLAANYNWSGTGCAYSSSPPTVTCGNPGTGNTTTISGVDFSGVKVIISTSGAQHNPLYSYVFTNDNFARTSATNVYGAFMLSDTSSTAHNVTLTYNNWDGGAENGYSLDWNGADISLSFTTTAASLGATLTTKYNYVHHTHSRWINCTCNVILVNSFNFFWDVGMTDVVHNEIYSYSPTETDVSLPYTWTYNSTLYDTGVPTASQTAPQAWPVNQVAGITTVDPIVITGNVQINNIAQKCMSDYVCGGKTVASAWIDDGLSTSCGAAPCYDGVPGAFVSVVTQVTPSASLGYPLGGGPGYNQFLAPGDGGGNGSLPTWPGVPTKARFETYTGHTALTAPTPGGLLSQFRLYDSYTGADASLALAQANFTFGGLSPTSSTSGNNTSVALASIGGAKLGNVTLTNNYLDANGTLFCAATSASDISTAFVDDGTGDAAFTGSVSSGVLTVPGSPTFGSVQTGQSIIYQTSGGNGHVMGTVSSQIDSTHWQLTGSASSGGSQSMTGAKYSGVAGSYLTVTFENFLAQLGPGQVLVNNKTPYVGPPAIDTLGANSTNGAGLVGIYHLVGSNGGLPLLSPVTDGINTSWVPTSLTVSGNYTVSAAGFSTPQPMVLGGPQWNNKQLTSTQWNSGVYGPFTGPAVCTGTTTNP